LSHYKGKQNVRFSLHSSDRLLKPLQPTDEVRLDPSFRGSRWVG